MKLKRKYKTKDEIPEALRNSDLYVEKNGEYVLDGIEGMDVFAMDTQINDRNDKIKDLVAENESLKTENTKSKEDYEALKKEKGSKDSAVELAEMKRKLDEAESEKTELKTSLTAMNEKVTLGEIRKHLEPVVAKLIIDDPKAKADVINSMLNDFTITEQGHVVTREDLGEQSFMKPDSYVELYVKDRPYLAKQKTGDHINNKDRFSFDDKSKGGNDFSVDDAPDIGDLITEAWKSE